MVDGQPRLLLLGPVRIDAPLSPGNVSPKARLLAARLAVSAPHAVATDALIDQLWVDDPPATVRKNLQKYVWELRRALGRAAVSTESSGYRLDCDSDLGRLEELLTAARKEALAGKPDRAAPLLDEALGLVRGRPMEGLDDVDFVNDEARRIGDLLVTAEEDLAEAELELGRHGQAIGRLTRLVAEHPMRERLVASLMTALYRNGRHAEALDVYRDHARLIGEELGLEPTPQLRELEERILTHDRMLLMTEPAEPADTKQPTARSVAVLPCVDLSAEGDQADLCEGLAVEMIASLSRVDGIRVASRRASFAYSGTDLGLRQIADGLGVTSILEGSVRAQGDRVRITVELTDCLDGYQLWAETFDRPRQDVFAIQQEVAEAVVSALEVKHSGTVRESGGAPTIEAFDLYLRGRHHFYRGGLEESHRALELFERASQVAPEPGFALASAGAADTCSFLHLYYEPSEEHLMGADKFSRRAIEIDPGIAETHASRGFALSTARRYDASAAEFEHALLLPGGRFETPYLYGRTLLCAGDARGAVQQFEAAAAVRPEEFHSWALLAKMYRAVGDEKLSLRAHQRVYELVSSYLRLVPDDARAIGDGACALVAMDRISEGISWAERGLMARHSPMPYYAASALAQAGRHERALDALEQVIDVGWSHPDFLANDPDWSDLRGLERFQALLQRIS